MASRPKPAGSSNCCGCCSTPEQIAETLHVSPKTVANPRYLAGSKPGVSSDIELVRLALRQRLLVTRDRSGLSGLAMFTVPIYREATLHGVVFDV